MHQPEAPPFMALAKESLAPLEFIRLISAIPKLALEARGNGEPVVVLPGFAASNTSTAILRSYLSLLGYDAHGWSMGRNEGDVQMLLPQVARQILELRNQNGQKVNIIGWSLGGVIGREVARENPTAVRQVITMGSPIIGGPKYTSLGQLFENRGADLDKIEAAIAARESTPIRVPVTSIYSRNDGIVGWKASIDRYSPRADHIEVDATHFSLGISPEVFRILAQKLAQP